MSERLIFVFCVAVIIVLAVVNVNLTLNSESNIELNLASINAPYSNTDLVSSSLEFPATYSLIGKHLNNSLQAHNILMFKI